MSYVNAFIAVAKDSRATEGRLPPERAAGKSIARWEYELISAHPYRFTQEEVQFRVHCLRQGIPCPERGLEKLPAWKEFFAKPKACLRTSALARTYGWGFHFDPRGRVAVVGVGTPEYETWARDRGLQQTFAMSRARV